MLRWALNGISPGQSSEGAHYFGKEPGGCGWYVGLHALQEKQMSHFDERSGVVYCKTGWGQWGQTIEEVFIEVDVAEGTKARNIRCDIKPKSISLAVSNEVLIQVL